MSYLNDQVGCREELLTTRSAIKKENYVLLELDGLVRNSIPGYENCDVAILESPTIGATFADYLVTVKEDGKNSGIGNEGLETFIYVLTDKVVVENADKEESLTEGDYIFSPGNVEASFKNRSDKEVRLYVYKHRYERIEEYSTFTIVGNADDTPWTKYEEMDSCHIRGFLPAAGNFGFDMNMHTPRFRLGTSHGYVETHIQEHGIYFLSGKDIYRANNDWVPVEAGDYMLPDACCPQACYAVGREEDSAHVYSKDCSRDVRL